MSKMWNDTCRSFLFVVTAFVTLLVMGQSVSAAPYPYDLVMEQYDYVSMQIDVVENAAMYIPLVSRQPAPTAPLTPTISLPTFIIELEDALNSTADQADVLPLATDQFLMSEWWGEWEDLPDTALADQLDEMHMTGPMSTELVPNEPLWFMDDMNPYTDVLPSDNEVAAVLLTHGWNADGDSQALLFITISDTGEYEWNGMVLTEVGFIR